MNKYFEHPNFEHYSFDDIPLDQDLYIMDEVYIQEYEKAFLSFFKGDNFLNIGSVGFVTARKVNENSIELSLYPNTDNRFHEISILLHKNNFVCCVGCYQYDEKPHIFVKGQWIKSIYTKKYSVFAMIDAINVKKALEEGIMTREKLIELRDRIDILSGQYTDISFISFADNILLKSNWSIGHFESNVKYDYKPEVFIQLAKIINNIYIDILGLNTYTIIAQGNNEYYDDSLLHISPCKNHISLNSLGVPFAQILEIESTIRTAIREKKHDPAQLYLDEQYYNSLLLKYEFKKENLPSNSYLFKMISKPCQYFFTDINNILENLETKT